MIIPGQAMLVSETVYKAGVPATPDSITAILYRIVAGVRSASGVTVTVSSTANTGEYAFSWTNDAGWNRTDDLELKAIPVIDGKSYPMVVWRSHGHVDAVMRGTDNAANQSSVDTLLSRVTSTVKTTWDNLAAMITGNGTTAAFTETALGNVPAVDVDGLAEDVTSALLASLSGEPIRFVASFNPGSRLLTLYQDVDYATGAVSGTIDIPMGDDPQFEDGDDVYLSLFVGQRNTSQFAGKIAIVAGVPLARFDGMTPVTSGTGTWELWHVNDDGKRSKPVHGSLIVERAIQSPPA